jgi:hypothetical protein
MTRNAQHYTNSEFAALIEAETGQRAARWFSVEH